ncbi:MAG: serine/threonine protein kinase [Myxococcales bacterium]|nr:serine/threonine protein kinase [Myxococcales bacterium]
MNRTSFPSGQVSACFVKALLLFLEAERGTAVTDEWLKAIKMLRDDLEDETRGLPLTSHRDALREFVSRTSRETVAETWRFIIASENLGFWMRILRGTHGPHDAFARLDATDSEYGRTTRWTTLVSTTSSWRGRVTIAHDPSIEADGLLTLSRAAELAAVPALFGFGRGVVTSLGDGEIALGRISQEFEVRWDVPAPARAAAVGALTGAAVSSAGFLGAPPTVGAALFALGVAGGGALGALWGRERQRRAEAGAQHIRVQALERTLALKEWRQRTASGTLEGTVVAGEYRIKERMGAGASGVIFEAERLRDGLPVALKLLRAVAAHEAVASDRLRREAEALGLAWHPNVVEVIDHGHLPDGSAFLVMELLRGESLSVRLRQGPLTPAQLLPIAIQVCDAIGAVHAAGIVHRDVKPANIFLALKDDVEIVKLLDFGIARVEWEETRITNMGAPLGTPGYMSPEQEAGGTIDARSDVFALGAVLFECLVGEPPPPTPSGLWLAGVTEGAPRNNRVAEELAKLPPAWSSLVTRALSARPEDRYQDARSIAQTLREIEAGRAAVAEGG